MDDYSDLPFDASYLPVLKMLESNPKERQFLFWTSKDLDSIPLVSHFAYCALCLMILFSEWTKSKPEMKCFRG